MENVKRKKKNGKMKRSCTHQFWYEFRRLINQCFDQAKLCVNRDREAKINFEDQFYKDVILPKVDDNSMQLGHEGNFVCYKEFHT